MAISLRNRQKRVRVETRWLRRVGGRALSVLARPRAECSVLLVEDSAIAELNRAYRGVAGPTDVLAFPMTEGRFGRAWPSSRALRQAQGFVVSAQPNGPEQSRGTQAEGPDLLGDVVISAETARRQARPGRGGVRAELALLLVHGILHLVGYDHGTAEERRRMRHKQRAILAACGIQAPAAAGTIRAPARGRRRAVRSAPVRRGGRGWATTRSG